MNKTTYIIIFIATALTLFIITTYIINKNIIDNKAIKKQQTERERNLYSKKTYYLTNIEKRFYKFLKRNFKRYLILPQINLASLINKNGRYRSELFRNIDFGVFTQDLQVLCLIELNDNSHLKQARLERDYKVKQLLAEVKIPLVTIWLKDKLTANQIIKQIKLAIKETKKSS